MDEQDYKSIILYYGREKYFHSMQSKTIEALTKFPADLCFRLYNGFALVLGNRIQEGIRELNPMQTDSEYGMSGILALIYAHKRCTVVDKEALFDLDQRLKEERKNLTSQSAYNAAIFLFLSGKIEKAKEYVEKSIRLLRTIDAIVLRAWCDLLLHSSNVSQIIDAFEEALKNSKNIDAYLGQVRYHQENNDFETAITVLNHLSIRYPDMYIPMVEKMKIQLASWNWDQSVETAARILNLEPLNIDALCIKTLGLICYMGKYESGSISLKQLYSALTKREPSNAELFLHMAILFSRTCGRYAEILNCTILFAEKATQICSTNTTYITELAYQYIMLGRYKEAVKYFRSAIKLDDSSIEALCGLTLCQMSDMGTNDQVKQQIEFLSEIEGTNKSPKLLFMSSKITENNVERAVSSLIESCEIHFKNLKTFSYGIEYLKRFDPDFLLELTAELLKYSPVQPFVSETEATPKGSLQISLKHSLNILESIVKACPGSVLAIYQLAKVEFMCGKMNAASDTLKKILNDIDPAYTDAHLLSAQIHIQFEQYQCAAQSLETCLSYDFGAHSYPMYHLLNGIIKKSQMQLEDALKSFQIAMNISLKEDGTNKTSFMNKTPTVLTLSDRVTLHLQMIDVYLLKNQQAEAINLINRTFEEFSNTPEEGRVIIVNAEIALQQKKIQKVIQYLESIQPGQPYYIQAKTRLAYVFLQHKKDRNMFAECFKELVDNMPTPESYLMLGDAYMSIQVPEEAVNAFQLALRKNPSDPLLASKLGRAYVKTHQYNKAIEYYKDAIARDRNSTLKLDLAELFLKLKQFSNAEQLLMDDINANENDETAVLHMRTKQFLLLARVREKCGHLNLSLATLQEARENQLRLQKRMFVEQSTNVHEQNTTLVKICSMMAEQTLKLRDMNHSINCHKEVLKYSPKDVKAMTSLARLYMRVNDINGCQAICSSILKIDINNEVASVMMADLSFRQINFEGAAYHFSQLLIAKPTYWTALARLIEVLRRAAMLNKAVVFLERAIRNSSHPNQEGGLNFCKGLYEWYNGNPNNALRFFNYARRDPEWGQKTICNMIEICLNPDDELPNENVSDESDIEIRESKLMALKTAERLLKELKPDQDGSNDKKVTVRLLTNFHLLASRQKQCIEMAFNDFSEMAIQDDYKDHIGPIYGLATSYIFLKQPQRAKNQLKRVVKNVWTFEDAEYLEKCWLMLAYIYVQANKHETAHDLLDKVIAHNKSCAKAYEISAQMAEKDQVFRLAAIQYDLAWRNGGRTKPGLGYKLALNFMKNKRYAEAIDVCQQVLKLHPDYLSIKKDILDKCRNNLRT